MQAGYEQQIQMLVREARHRKGLMVGLFAVISLSLLMMGAFWPKTYNASTTVLVDEQNILGPLMEGAAVPTDVDARSRMAASLVFSRSIMDGILKEGGWENEIQTPEDRARTIMQIRQRTNVSVLGAPEDRNPGPANTLVRISYQDTDPDRAYRIANRFGELFVSEGLVAKRSESRSAYEFINRQVEHYGKQVSRAADALKAFRTEHADLLTGTEEAIRTRIDDLRARIQDARLAMQDARIASSTAMDYLQGESGQESEELSLVSQYQTQMQELRLELNRLRMRFHDSHPDVVNVQSEIASLERAIEEARANGGGGSSAVASLGSTYDELRTDLSAANRTLNTGGARISALEQALQEEMSRVQDLPQVQSQLAELQREYEVNQSLYQDLLTRRENARISMNMDLSNKGLTLSVYEPPQRPEIPGGPRFVHFAAAAIMLGTMMPFGLLYGWLRLDRRVRSEHELSDQLQLPVLGTVPHLPSPGETRAERTSSAFLFLVVGLVVAIIAYVGWLKMTGDWPPTVLTQWLN